MNKDIKKDWIRREDESFTDFVFRTWESVIDDYELKKELVEVLRTFDIKKDRAHRGYADIYNKRLVDKNYEERINREFELRQKELATNLNVPFRDIVADSWKNLRPYPSEMFEDFMVRTWWSMTKEQRLEKYSEFDPSQDKRTYAAYESIKVKRESDPNYTMINPEDKLQESLDFNVNADGVYKGTIQARLSTSRDTKEIIYEKLGINPELFEIVSYGNSSWNAQRAGGEIVEMNAIKFTAKPINQSILHEFNIDKLIERHNKGIKPLKIKTLERKVDNNLMLEIPLMDVHLNKYSTKAINGEDYNADIVEKRLNKITDVVVKEFSHVKNFLIQIGQDFFNIDNLNNTTTAGTPQDTNMFYEEMLDRGYDLLHNMITTLAQLGNVQVVFVPGNHDRVTSYHLTKMFEKVFEKTKQISVDASPRQRKYIQWGKNLIGLTHGDKEGKRLGGLMQQEAPEMWAATDFRTWHMGHLHTQNVVEENGIVFVRMSAISGMDRWHKDSGYIGSKQGAQLHLWHKENNLESVRNIWFKNEE